MIGIGILGCGRIGLVHGRSVAASFRGNLIAVADALPEAAQKLADELGCAVRSNDEIIADPTVDAIIICTPTETHAELIEKAAAAGKTILCEKPLDLSAERIRSCLDAIKGTDSRLMMGFQRRYDPNFVSLKKRLEAGSVGELELLMLTSRDPAPPPMSYIKTSGGIFADMMIHDLDMARYLMEEEPVEIHATGSVLVDPEIATAGDFDTVAATLKTASGKICQISCSRRATYGFDQRVEVHGSTGMARAANVHETTVEIANSEGFHHDPAVNLFLERYMPAYQAELTYFFDCIESGVQPRPTGEDGLKAQILADAALQSCLTGTVIKLEG